DRWKLEHSWGARVRRLLTPARLLVLSFLGLIALGTGGFMVLPGLYVGEPLSWLDALFTATSAVCVTGLIVVDTATYFTTWGQAYILLLIQLGGLGILTFTTLIILALGRRLSLHHEAVTANTAEVAPDIDFKQLVRNIVRFTFLFEAAGALLLFVLWLPRFTFGDAAWHAVFQAVSAFCNAGFSTFSDSLTGFQGAPVSLTVVMTLIVLGGLGFLTLEELHLRWREREGNPPLLSLHSRLVLTVTGVLLFGGWIVFTSLEWGNTMADMAGWEKLVNGLFMSVTARTAGFNTVDYAATAESTNFITILLMSIGGSPGSTAGGLKTTSVAVIGLLAFARLRGHQVTSVGHRTIPEETVQRAVGLFVVGFIVVTGGILLYAVFQLRPVPGETPGGRFLLHMFEAVSAFNTVGLSMGATGELIPASKLLTIALMYVGRVGPLTFAAAIALGGPTLTGEFRYAYEDVIIG
ncbi:MAG TPA: potassium transporter TrkG, partial [Longimicrobiales bacterium]|nr:potassium transporter TrkG [Longimicrobiales bacterium]